MPSIQTFLSNGRWFIALARGRRLTGLAAEVSFWLFLSLLPLAAVGGMIVAKIAVLPSEHADPWLMTLSESTQTFLTGELSRVAAWNGGAVAPIGVLVFAWLASAGVHSLFDAFDAMAMRNRRWLKKRLLSLFACLLLPIAFAVAGVAMSGIDGAAHRLGLPPHLTSFGPFIRFLAATAALLILVVGLYEIGVPRGRRVADPVLPGALVATVLHIFFTIVYRLILRITGDGTAYLAGLAIISVTMTFVYLYVFSLLIGVAFNRWWRIVRRIARGAPRRAKGARASTSDLRRRAPSFRSSFPWSVR